jgi:hypothetical protein
MEPTLAEKKIGIFFNLKLFLILVTENLNSGFRNTAVANYVGGLFLYAGKTHNRRF